MLTSTFIHAQGIGPKTEMSIWRSGVRTWDDFLGNYDSCNLSEAQRSLLLPLIEESANKLASGDYAFFAATLPPRERWRAYREFGSGAAFLDIETVGTGMDDAITVIGVFDGERTTTYIKGYNMEQFASDIEQYSLLVTYAGSSFDLPHIRHAFPGLRLDQIHVDLCPTLRRLGLTGGLKQIELKAGLRRPTEVEGLDGWDAVRLWHEYEWGSREALDLLVAYNAQDVVNLKPLAERAYAELFAATLGSIEQR